MAPNPTLEYNIKAWCSGGCSRPPSKRHDFGLDFEPRDDGHFYITRVEALAKDFTEVRVGDRLYSFQDKPAAEYSSVDELNAVLSDALKISIETLHPEKMKQEIKTIDLPVQRGDVVPLKDYPAKPEYNGINVEILRKLQKGKLLVSPVGRKKERLLVDASNLHFELEVDKLQLRDRQDDDSDDDGDGDGDGDGDNVDEEETVEEAKDEDEEETDDKKEEASEPAAPAPAVADDKKEEASEPAAPAPAVAIEAS
jgi:hypothetical protein